MTRPVSTFDFHGAKRRFVLQAFAKLNLPPDAESDETDARINELHDRRIEMLDERQAFDVPDNAPYTPTELEWFVDHKEKLIDHDEIVVLREIHYGGRLGKVIFMMAKSYGASLIGKNFHVRFDTGAPRTIRRGEPASLYPVHWTRGLKVAAEAGLNTVSEVGGVAQMNAYITSELILARLGMRLAYDIGFLSENEVVEGGKPKRVASAFLSQETWGRAKERIFARMGFRTIPVTELGDEAYEHVVDGRMPYKPGTDIPNRVIKGHTIRIGLGPTADLIAMNVSALQPAQVVGFSEIQVGKATSRGKTLTVSSLLPVTFFGSEFDRETDSCPGKRRAVAEVRASAYDPSLVGSPL